MERQTWILAATGVSASIVVSAAMWLVFARHYDPNSLNAAAIGSIAALLGGLVVAHLLFGFIVPRWVEPTKDRISTARAEAGAVLTVVGLGAVIASDSLVPAVLLAAAWVGASYAIGGERHESTEPGRRWRNRCKARRWWWAG